MKITVNINDEMWARLKKEAARQQCTMSEIAEKALQQFLEMPKRPKRLPKLPRFDCGEFLVDIADQDALYEAMEKDEKKLY
jgi:hypothetical protein